MEEDTLDKCTKLIKAYRRLVQKEPNVSTEYVVQKVSEAADIYLDILGDCEFAKDMIGRVIYHIIELETERKKEQITDRRVI